MDRLFLETKIAVDDSGVIEGIAWPFGTPDRVGDVIEKGAFANVQWPIPMLFSHDGGDPVGVWPEGIETDAGLMLKGQLLVNEVARAREVAALVRSGAIRGLSIGFTTKQAVSRKGGGRTIKSLELVECSLVAVPMHPGARVTSAKAGLQALRLSEEINRAVAALQQRGTA